MREEMEHHTLMGEVWQEERGSMKLVLQAEIGRERESDDDRCRTRSVRLDWIKLLSPRWTRGDVDVPPYAPNAEEAPNPSAF
jgi:hypothetical protein